jgi:hypothetical protein
VSRSETIQRLQALLERVRTRSTEPRRPPAQANEAPSAVETRSAGTEIAADGGVAVETSQSEEHDSRERLVGAEPALELMTATAAASSFVESPSSMDAAEIVVTANIEVAEEEIAEDEVADQDDDVGPAPASSRRPVAPEPEERLAEMAFGSEEPLQPLHTPPPESGRLPAAPSLQFEPDRDFDGLRDATPLLPRRPLASEIQPEAVRPDLAGSDAVGELIAHAQRFAPATFVALLDASLAL